MASSSSPQEVLGYQDQRERSTVSLKEYDVFISQRGPDVENTFAKQLYNILQERGCHAFLNCEEIKEGDSLVPSAVRNGICSSFVQIAIFCQGYSESSSFLDELVLMLEQPDALFIPVFFDVQPLELRNIANKRSSFYFSLRTGRNFHKLNERERALIAASYFSGYELGQHNDNLCEMIVSRVLQVLREKEKWTPLHVAEYPVGLAELVQDFESCCSETEKEDKVRMVGIFGHGGSGKTTLAKELFNMKRLGYNASCFLSDVRESHAKGELHCLQSQLFKDLFDEDRKFMNIDEGLGKLKDRLERARHLDFLIVLDDIDHRDQLGALLLEGMLRPGSLVIVTTRIRSLLTGADICYKMKGMDKYHAKDLFCSHAFRGRDLPIAYEKLVESFVEFCGGLPLSLKILGAHVYGRDEHYWELELEKVRKSLPKDIMERLIISFNGLNSQETQIFIDIACFLDMKLTWYMKNRASLIWNASGWNAEDAVQKLQDKCLIEVGSGDFQSFEMQNHFRDLGRQMADELGPPRLWQPELLKSMEAKGFKQILAETKSRCFHSFKDSSLKTNITYFIGTLNESAEADLLLLDIDNYRGNFKSIPSWIPLRKLRCLIIRNMEEIWNTLEQQLQINTQASLELRVLKIFESPSLQNLPDLIGMCSHLEVLYISSSLENTDVTSFVQSLKKMTNLRSLELWFGGTLFFSGNLDLSKGGDSTNFEAASTSSCMNSLETAVFRRLDNISKLVISGEICPRLRSLEVMHMFNLNEIDLKQLESLNNLQVLGCDKLETLSGLKELEKLNTLTVQRCLRLEIISGLSSVIGLRELHTESCNGLKSLPNLSDLRNLERITIAECQQLQSVEGVEKLQELKSLVIGGPDSGDANVFNCIHGLRRLPSEFAILTRKPVDRASSRMDVNLFSEVIGAEAVAEIEKEKDGKGLTMIKSSSAITVYALLVTSKIGFQVSAYQTSLVSFRQLQGGIFMVTVLLTSVKTKVTITNSATILGGFKATVNEGEEGKALTVLQRIVDRLYQQNMEPMLAVCDVASGSGSIMECD
ncbi:hypothetical protein SUGI_0666520 [Cryptomeria japonica]|nr:hypothetical protein SUGI_0666520 [Cryptomeria japonica]